MDNFDKKDISLLENVQTKSNDLDSQNLSKKNEIFDKLNDLKKEIKEEINHLKWDASPILNGNKSTFKQFNTKVELLRHQLDLANAETKEELIQQRKNILKGLKDIKKILAKG